MYQCPCCGYYTLPAPPDWALAYICPVCYWENDVFIKSGNERSDENGGITLMEGRENYQKYGAVLERLTEYTRPPTEEEKQGE